MFPLRMDSSYIAIKLLAETAPRERRRMMNNERGKYNGIREIVRSLKMFCRYLIRFLKWMRSWTIVHRVKFVTTLIRRESLMTLSRDSFQYLFRGIKHISMRPLEAIVKLTPFFHSRFERSFPSRRYRCCPTSEDWRLCCLESPSCPYAVF